MCELFVIGLMDEPVYYMTAVSWSSTSLILFSFDCDLAYTEIAAIAKPTSVYAQRSGRSLLSHSVDAYMYVEDVEGGKEDRGGSTFDGRREAGKHHVSHQESASACRHAKMPARLSLTCLCEPHLLRPDRRGKDSYSLHFLLYM